MVSSNARLPSQSSIIYRMVANNSILFPCSEIIGVFNFQADARIQKFFTQIFGHEDLSIYGITCKYM